MVERRPREARFYGVGLGLSGEHGKMKRHGASTRRVGSLSWRQLYQQFGTDPTKARVASPKTHREGDLYWIS